MYIACVEDNDTELDTDELVQTVFQQEESLVVGDMEHSVLDCGSTLHICNDLKWFVPGTLAPVGAKGGSITTGGGVVHFLLKGTVAVQLLQLCTNLLNDDVDIMRSWPKGVWHKSKKLSVETDECGHLVDTQASIEDIQLEMPAESTNKGGASAELMTLSDVSGIQDFSPVESSKC
ncbi:hypothetical protein CFIMG_008699RA00001 [Ceratocystis fimbriata CBS 114723]|uniref:Uncharacterized protein n=1 Tax=Ceratocystis fimbriata CBS 114723 TaxID=1035309 RepID=A0A2C5X0F5_9PEZI|nr:hypothetical protein CFIMG_008699RA00001 [Ceratocystis fimbriata CBS 114723]